MGQACAHCRVAEVAVVPHRKKKRQVPMLRAAIGSFFHLKRAAHRRSILTALRQVLSLACKPQAWLFALGDACGL